MQTPNLPIQISGASPSPNASPARQKNGAGDGAQFSQALRQAGAQAPTPAPAKPAGPAKAQQAAPADKAAPAKPAGEPPRPAKADGDAAAGKADSEDGAAQAAQAAASGPVVDMLALVASLQQPVAATVAAAGDAAGDALPAGGAGAIAAGQALAGLQPAARAPVHGQPAQAGATTDAAGAAPDAAFSNMMAAADGSALDGPKPGAVRSDNTAAPALGRLATDTAAERPAAGPAAPVQGNAVPDLAQAAGWRTREAAPEPAALKDVQVGAPVAAPLQQAALGVAQAAAGAPAAGDKIAARVGTPAWDSQVGQKIVWMVAGKEQSASLTLNPPDMGPMQVVLNVTNDQATVTFSAAQPEVRQALEQAMPRLREMMNESGISLGNASVNDGAANQQQAQGEAQRRGGAGGRIGNGGAAEAVATTVARPVRGGEQGLVDTFA